MASVRSKGGSKLGTERRRCEFFLVRYVPDPVKNEFVNIGVLLREAAEGREGGASGRQTVVRFTRDWRRVRCVDPEADTAMLEALEAEIRQRLGESAAGVRPLISVLEDSFSNQLQLTVPKGCLADNLLTETEQLMRLYVEPRKREPVVRSGGRQAIYGSMRSQFERAGVWELMRKRIAASRYTRAGDPLHIDCGYRPNGVIRMFHAVSLDGDLETAKVLAFSLAGLRKGILAAEGADLELTAVVEPLGAWKEKAGVDAERMEHYAFARETMEQAEIRVLTTGDLPRVAETARGELLG